MSEVVERMERLKAEALECRRCELCETRTNVVFGEGNPETPLVIIGEGPGATEDATGRPFVGRAGQLLDQALRENGITRKHVYICNVLKCRAITVEDGSVRNRPPNANEIAMCLPWLQKQIEIIQPLVILCLGAPAANTIIHKGFQMTKERGQWFPTPYARYATAALHPAYILRQHGEAFESARASLVADIAAARLKVIEAKKEPKLSLF
ncbi:MAG: uracil-DNA glycosylase [Armatimonadetes bacterium]|nr:uracil-DNA glycosylase [Armatimonadota bacterium]